MVQVSCHVVETVEGGWYRGGVKCIHIYSCVSEDRAADVGDIVIMNNYRHRKVNKLSIRLHRIVV